MLFSGLQNVYAETTAIRLSKERGAVNKQTNNIFLSFHKFGWAEEEEEEEEEEEHEEEHEDEQEEKEEEDAAVEEEELQHYTFRVIILHLKGNNWRLIDNKTN